MSGRRLHQSLISEVERVTQSLALCKSLAHYISYTCRRDYDDLVQEGSIGMLAAILNFDSTRQVALKTYVRPRIWGAMIDSFKYDKFGDKLISIDSTKGGFDESGRNFFIPPEMIIFPNVGDPLQTKHLEAAIATLSTREQTAIQLYFYGQQTFLEVSRSIGLNKSGAIRVTGTAVKKLQLYLSTLPHVIEPMVLRPSNLANILNLIHAVKH